MRISFNMKNKKMQKSYNEKKNPKKSYLWSVRQTKGLKE